jgi:hypothetical protein
VPGRDRHVGAGWLIACHQIAGRSSRQRAGPDSPQGSPARLSVYALPATRVMGQIVCKSVACRAGVPGGVGVAGPGGDVSPGLVGWVQPTRGSELGWVQPAPGGVSGVGRADFHDLCLVSDCLAPIMELFPGLSAWTGRSGTPTEVGSGPSGQQTWSWSISVWRCRSDAHGHRTTSTRCCARPTASIWTDPSTGPSRMLRPDAADRWVTADVWQDFWMVRPSLGTSDRKGMHSRNQQYGDHTGVVRCRRAVRPGAVVVPRTGGMSLLSTHVVAHTH